MRKLLALALLTFSLSASAQEADSLPVVGGVFRLGEVLVWGTSADSANELSSREMEKFNRTEISTALNLLAGVTLSNVGARNESVVYVRGFDLRQVPVFIDGVPVYVPYDGYVDMGRFTTADIARLSVSKGFASILYGANTMGGAINLVSRRPVRALEVTGAGWCSAPTIHTSEERMKPIQKSCSPTSPIIRFSAMRITHF